MQNLTLFGIYIVFALNPAEELDQVVPPKESCDLGNMCCIPFSDL